MGLLTCSSLASFPIEMGILPNESRFVPFMCPLLAPFSLKSASFFPYHLFFAHYFHSFESILYRKRSGVLNQSDVEDTLQKLHSIYVLVPADKDANNVIAVCMQEVLHIDTLVKELKLNDPNNNNPTYLPTGDPYETIVNIHNHFITSAGMEMSEENQNLLYLYWTPKLNKSPYKH